MKKYFLPLRLLIFLTPFFSTFANASDQSKLSETVTLDQFHNVAFEQFSGTAFSLDLLKSKSKFGSTGFIFGGSAEADFQHWQGDKIFIINPPSYYQQGTAFYFTQATLDLMLNFNSWMTGYISGADSAIGQGGSSGNYYYSPRSLLLLGNLEKFPLFLTAGINTIPFGNFVGAGIWNRPLTLSYFYTQQAPQLSLAYHDKNWDMNATTYRDQVLYQGHSAYSLKYSNAIKSLKYAIGAGYLTHLNFNTTGWPTLDLSGIPVIANLNARNVKNFNATLRYKQISLFAEYLIASKKVNINNHPPNALSYTIQYTPNLFGTHYLFGLNYSKSNDLAGVPSALLGKDQLAQAAAGIKNGWAANVVRKFTKWSVLGVDIERTESYKHKRTYTYTLDFTFYL